MSSHNPHDHHGRAADHDHSDDHPHGAKADDNHKHPRGIWGFLYGLSLPHTHDTHDSIDDALEASATGIGAVKISLLGLAVTAGIQMIVVIISG